MSYASYVDKQCWRPTLRLNNSFLRVLLLLFLLSKVSSTFWCKNIVQVDKLWPLFLFLASIFAHLFSLVNIIFYYLIIPVFSWSYYVSYHTALWRLIHSHGHGIAYPCMCTHQLHCLFSTYIRALVSFQLLCYLLVWALILALNLIILIIQHWW